ncbi:hypothetical protein ACOMHN_059952 [Nucella lapillus]
MVTDWRSVPGLERRVVVALGAGVWSGWDLAAMSRCSGHLYTIDCGDDDSDGDDSDGDDSDSDDTDGDDNVQ